MHYNEIPCLVDHETREDCIDYAVNKIEDGMILVELGSYLGGSVARLACKLKEKGIKCKIYAIDNWVCSNISRESLMWSQLTNHSEIFEKFKNNLEQLDLTDYVTYIRSETKDVAEQFEDKSVNYIFFDACHGFDGVKDEVMAWLPKFADRCFAFIHDWPMQNIREGVYSVIPKEQIKDVRGGSSAILRDTL